jgi:hypothetical protein
MKAVIQQTLPTTPTQAEKKARRDRAFFVCPPMTDAVPTDLAAFVDDLRGLRRRCSGAVKACEIT